ncbi:respiratory burst oxidase homolog protein E-like [Magnolia sinica]|uniref:respiratory burst oxidase homolog protein E-like n=1 Tax=Magnolia sinica TaxID=86752 RepID=UPI00265A08D5|nr:respiratory burst oxidase homolog protein E-like [Magnolia sinica]
MQRENNRRGSTRGEDFSSLLPYAAMASAFTNKLLKSKEQAEEYPFFIMEELNPKNFGYITVHRASNHSPNHQGHASTIESEASRGSGRA